MFPLGCLLSAIGVELVHLLSDALIVVAIVLVQLAQHREFLTM
jgi:hypothetical protein